MNPLTIFISLTVYFIQIIQILHIKACNIVEWTIIQNNTVVYETTNNHTSCSNDISQNKYKNDYYILCSNDISQNGYTNEKKQIYITIRYFRDRGEYFKYISNYD